MCTVQHLNVMVDACVLGEADSPFLQQAADMTKGAYLRPGCSPALLQYLLVRVLSCGSCLWSPCARMEAVQSPACIAAVCMSRPGRDLSACKHAMCIQWHCKDWLWWSPAVLYEAPQLAEG